MLRLASANGLADPSPLETVAGLRAGYAAGTSGTAVLAELAGADEDGLAALAWNTRPAAHGQRSRRQVSPAMLDLVHPKVCPACLSEEPWIRRLWDVRTLVACPVHGCMLVDRCQGCGARLRWRRGAIARCPCDADLASGPETAGAPLVGLSRLLAAAADGLTVPRATPITDLDTAARLLWFLAADPSHPGAWRSMHMAKPEIRDTSPMLQRAAPVLLDWPAGLHAWLGERAGSAGLSGRTGVRAAFGPALHRLLASLPGPHFGFLHAEIRRWLAEEWRGGRVKPWSPLHAHADRPAVVSGKEAAVRLGIRSPTVAAMVGSGELEGRSAAAGRRMFTVVDTASVELAASRPQALEGREAARRLGVTVRRMRDMLRTGILASGPATGRGRIAEASLADLDARLAARTAVSGARVSGPATLAELSGSRRVALLPVLRAALDGGLARSGGLEAPPSAPMTERYAVDPARAFERSAAERTGTEPEECLSVREAAAVLGMSVRMVPWLVRAGCLESASVGGGPPGRRTVTRASAEAFGSRFCGSLELAARQGTSTRTVVARLTEAGVVPVVAASSAHGISAVWDRRDLAGFRGADGEPTAG